MTAPSPITASSITAPSVTATAGIPGDGAVQAVDYTYSNLALRDIRDGKIAAMAVDRVGFTASVRQDLKTEKISGEFENMAVSDFDSNAALAILDPARASGLRQGAGCPECRGSGYRGRVGIYELLIVDEPLRQAVCAGAAAGELERIARRNGFQNLREDALARALAGRTTLEEVLRVTGGHTDGDASADPEAEREAA